MSQLTIYLEEEMLRRVRKVARSEKRSVSEWTREKMLQGLKTGWPDGYFDLFGALQDDTFDRPPQGNLKNDIARQRL